MKDTKNAERSLSDIELAALKLDGPYQHARRAFFDARNVRHANKALKVMEARENFIAGHPAPLRAVQQYAVAQRTGRRP